MYCYLCRSILELVSESYDFDEHFVARDYFCSLCKSALVEKFYDDGKYVTDWILFNG